MLETWPASKARQFCPAPKWSAKNSNLKPSFSRTKLNAYQISFQSSRSGRGLPRPLMKGKQARGGRASTREWFLCIMMMRMFTLTHQLARSRTVLKPFPPNTRVWHLIPLTKMKMISWKNVCASSLNKQILLTLSPTPSLRPVSHPDQMKSTSL